MPRPLIGDLATKLPPTANRAICRYKFLNLTLRLALFRFYFTFLKRKRRNMHDLNKPPVNYTFYKTKKPNTISGVIFW